MSKLKVMKQREIYRLTAADYQIIELGKQDPNYITDYFMRSPTSGTYWRKTPIPHDEKTVRGWTAIYQAWIEHDQPMKAFEFNGIDYKLQWDEEGYPIFWHHHGWLWQDWQKDWYLCPQDEITVVGGMGSGKTAAEAIILATRAMTIPYYRGFAVAPQMIQATEIYKYLTYLKDTPWFANFVWNYPQKPYPKFVLRSDYIGESTIEILSIEHDSEKVRTLEGDEAFIDQAEKFTELDNVIRDLGSRTRGQIHGRPKLGKLHVVANAGENIELWQRYDMAEWEPDIYKNYNPGTWDNPYISDRDIANLKRRVGGNSADIDQWMGGRKPLGSGEHFPADMVRDCTDESLENIMDQALKVVHDARELMHSLGGKSDAPIEDLPEYQFKKVTQKDAGIVHWEMPPDNKLRQYITIGDPGQANPPDRNSGVVMTWDITNFPVKAAELRCFSWVAGKGSYWPFFYEYERQVKLYRSYGRNGFDSTGIQKGFDELVYVMMDLHAEGLNMAGSGKMQSINAAKMFMGKRLMRYPYIPHLSAQLSGYKLPDTKIRQDLVACLCMSALYMRRYYWEDVQNEEDSEPADTRHDRHYRPNKDRHTRNAGIRH